MAPPWDIEVNQGFPFDRMLGKVPRLVELVADRVGHLGLYN